MSNRYLKLNKKDSAAVRVFVEEDKRIVRDLQKMSKKLGFHTGRLPISTLWCDEVVAGFYPRRNQEVDTTLFKRLKCVDEVWFPRRAKKKQNKKVLEMLDGSRLEASFKTCEYLGLNWLVRGAAYRIGIRDSEGTIYIVYHPDQGQPKVGRKISNLTWERIGG